ncbi:hypothetical protein NQ502_08635 [Ruminococcus gauvreauii]|uniref:Uncharacterized protein n=1 Tax=Ruminococcus gauvreauii TaxID=438033 RepID=A0ABY5VKE7_9FIRM|nr:hypothetical protein [Ruminococcus gauvreauii]UWP61079.1 hypothetical protein NQ502_08635 [Ruminococcus gauvreauii]
MSATNTEGAKAAEVAFGAECQRGLTGDDRLLRRRISADCWKERNK